MALTTAPTSLGAGVLAIAVVLSFSIFIFSIRIDIHHCECILDFNSRQSTARNKREPPPRFAQGRKVHLNQ